MLVIPAVDLRDGKVVRLTRGEFSEETVYSEDPLSIAEKWVDEGATMLHIVDLDGALYGEIRNLGWVRKIIASKGVAVEFGGGIRTRASIEAALDVGVKRVILGTRAVEEDFIKEAVKDFGPSIAIGIDAREGMVATHGWTETKKISAVDLAKKVEQLGVRTIIYTDIARDGTLAGPNIQAIDRMLKVIENMGVIASGGISSLEDVKKLAKLGSHGLIGMIVGKAIYEGKLDLREAVEAVAE